MSSATKQHAFPRELSVVINCPFDENYVPLFESLIFAVASCGFVPRSALEIMSASVPRMDRIVTVLFSCKYSIHDLSLCRGEGTENLSRFNMPLELGMAIADHHHRSKKKQDKHDWFPLVPEGNAYRRFISDLSGYDCMSHNGTDASIVQAVMSWLTTSEDGQPYRAVDKVIAAIPTFRSALSNSTMGPRIPWRHRVAKAMEIANTLPFDGSGPAVN